jgi:hypothetical protein
MATSQHHFKLHYGGSVPWLVFWCIAFFPVGLVLFLSNFEYRKADGSVLSVKYHGSSFWLALWTLCFFPAAVLLMALNGFEVHEMAQV